MRFQGRHVVLLSTYPIPPKVSQGSWCSHSFTLNETEHLIQSHTQWLSQNPDPAAVPYLCPESSHVLMYVQVLSSNFTKLFFWKDSLTRWKIPYKRSGLPTCLAQHSGPLNKCVQQCHPSFFPQSTPNILAYSLLTDVWVGKNCFVKCLAFGALSITEGELQQAVAAISKWD